MLLAKTTPDPLDVETAVIGITIVRPRTSQVRYLSALFRTWPLRAEPGQLPLAASLE
jgi:hypothetical protein